MIKIPLDKQAHFWAGLAIASTLTAYGIPAHLAFIVGVGFGAGKEFADHFTHGQEDVKDFVATALGASGVLPSLLF